MVRSLEPGNVNAFLTRGDGFGLRLAKKSGQTVGWSGEKPPATEGQRVKTLYVYYESRNRELKDKTYI